MGQHCCCLSNKSKRLPPIKPIHRSKLDTSHLKTSLNGTCSQHQSDPKRRNPDYTKENADSVFPNGSLAVSIYDVQNLEAVHKSSNEEGEKRVRELNLESIFSEQKPRSMVRDFFDLRTQDRSQGRDFDFQQDLNKAKVNVLEIYKKDEKGGWKEDVGMKELCKVGEEMNKITYAAKGNRRESLVKRDVIEELAP